MKKILLTLGSVMLFALSLSAQITINKYNALPTSGSVFGKDEVATIRFDSTYTILHQGFDSANHNFVVDTFLVDTFPPHFMGDFVWDTSGSIHSNHLYQTNDSTGFVLVNGEGLSNDTLRVMLNSRSFSTMGYNALELYLNHTYQYSMGDSMVALFASTDSVNWNIIQNFTTSMQYYGTTTSFVTDTFMLGAQYLDKPNVYLRLFYATDTGGHWAINKLTVRGHKYTPTYNFFKPATNHTWDLSNIEYDGGVKYYPRRSAPAPYRFADSMYNEELKGMQYTTYGLNYFTVTGIHEWAQLTYEQAIGLGAHSGDTLDSLYIPVQSEIEYNNVHTKIAYPCTINTNWKSDYWFISGYQIKGPSFNLASKLDGKRFTQVTSRDTVKGWGKMRIKTAGGGVESYIDVLQLKTVYTQTDSFYLTGNGANAQNRGLFKEYMANSGLDTPKNTYNVTKISFIRVGEIHPLVTVFMNDTFITHIEIHQNHPWPLDVANVSMTEEAVKIYPNPLTGNVVNIALANPQDGNWACEVLNVMGQTVASQLLNLDRVNSTAPLNMPSTLAPGTYYLRLTKNGELMTVKPLTIRN